MNLFEAVEGRRSEDLATQVLLVLLESPAFRELQRLFYQLILRDGLLLCTEARQFRVATQESDTRLGRPDLKVEGEDTLLLVENKFSALFSPNQLPRYVEILEQAGRATSALALVCPNHMRTRYEQDALKQFGDRGARFPSVAELQAHLRTRNIKLFIVTWEELLRVLDSGHFLVTELASFVRERFLVHVEFTAEEVRRIMSTEIPEMLKKLFKLVDRIKGEIGGQGIEPGRSSQSVRVLGFSLSKNGIGFYFGYMFDLWIKYETPLFLKTSPTWGGNGRLREDALLQAEFVKETDNDFFLPIRLQEGDEAAVLAAVIAQLQQAIDGIARTPATGEQAAAVPVQPAQPTEQQPTT